MASATACPQLVRYLGCHMVSNRLWIVTEYLGGGSLGDLMAKTKRPIARRSGARRVLGEILRGLAFLHAQRRLHRDVKGKNVLVAEDGCQACGFWRRDATHGHDDETAKLDRHALLDGAGSHRASRA